MEEERVAHSDPFQAAISAPAGQSEGKYPEAGFLCAV